MRHVPRGRLPFVSVTPENQKTLVRVDADSAKVERAVVAKVAEDQEIKRLISSGALITADAAKEKALKPEAESEAPEVSLEDLFAAKDEESAPLTQIPVKKNNITVAKHVTMSEDVQTPVDILRDDELISIINTASTLKSQTTPTEKKPKGVSKKKES